MNQWVWNCSDLLFLLSSAETCVYTAATLTLYSPEAPFSAAGQTPTRKQIAAITEIVAKVWSEQK